MEKAIFSITCTTCHARLAVRSESAIGAILECPKCESMVQVVPPEGWTPAIQPGQETGAAAASPPPLDRISEAPLTLELEPAGNSLLGNLGILWSAAAVAAALLVWGLWSLLMPRTTPDSLANGALKNGATAGLSSSAGEIAKQPSPPPGSQSGGVSSTDDAGKTAENVSEEKGDGQPAPEPPPPAPEVPGVSPSSPSSPPDKSQPVAENPPLFPSAGDKDAGNGPPPAEPKKLPPPPADVAARLADPIAEIELNDVSLIGAIDLLSSMGAVPVTLDADALVQLGVAPRDRIALRLGPTTVGEALRAAAAERGLGLYVNGTGVILSAPPEYRETTRKVRYTVSDLAGEDQAGLEQLAGLIRALIAPQSWRGSSGEGTIQPDGDALSIVQTGEVHRRILIFCEKLRAARRLPLRSRGDPKLFSLDTRTERARKTLDRPATVNFHEPVPLGRILVFLGQATGTDILVDRAALAMADTSDGVEAALTARNQGLGKALTALLGPLGLLYRVVGDDLIQVTTPEAAEERLELEFHPIGPWLERGVSAERLIQQLMGRVAPVSWSDVGGEAEVYFDPPSKYLIVLQSQPAQVEIQRLLATPPQKK